MAGDRGYEDGSGNQVRRVSRGLPLNVAPLDRETAAVVTLWRAVLIKSITDLMWKDRGVGTQPYLTADNRTARDEARELLFCESGEEDLEMLCDLADLDATYVRRMAYEILAGRMPMPTAQSMGGDRRVLG
jgi:hypothetical protein